MIVMLSTIDNPYNPFTNYDEWLTYDLHNHNSCALLDQFAKTSSALSDQENNREIVRAIDEIVRTDPLGIYIKVMSNDDL